MTITQHIMFLMKAHYGEPLWGVTLYYFLKMCMFEYITFQTFERFSQYFCIYNLSKKIKLNCFISFYKMRDWSIFVKTNVMYLCIQKHKYISKII
jgi:hypothetical protein